MNKAISFCASLLGMVYLLAPSSMAGTVNSDSTYESVSEGTTGTYTMVDAWEDDYTDSGTQTEEADFNDSDDPIVSDPIVDDSSESNSYYNDQDTPN